MQVKKLQDRVDKSQKDVENTKDKYEEALAVLHKHNATYVDDMTEVFGKTQDFEEKRLRFFKDILIAIHGCLDISRSNESVFYFLILLWVTSYTYTPSFPTSFKSRLVLPFWYWLTQVVLEKRPLDGCSSVVIVTYRRHDEIEVSWS